MDELQVKTLPALDWHGIWPGKSDLSALKGQQIHLRFRLARAQLFAVTL